MSDEEQKYILRKIVKIREKLEKLEKAVTENLISEETYVSRKILKEEVDSLDWDFEVKLDFDWRLTEKEFQITK